MYQLYTNQTDAGNEIVKAFETHNYVSLNAEMQSGKTGCSMYGAFELLFKKYLEEKNKDFKIFVISGASETLLKTQWKDSLKSYVGSKVFNRKIRKFIKSLPYIRKLSSELEGDDVSYIIDGKQRTFLEVCKNVEVFFNADLREETNLEKLRKNCVIIWDESHYGSSEKQTLHKTFSGADMMAIVQCKSSEAMKESNRYVLSVSATKSSEKSCEVYKNDKSNVWKSVTMVPGVGYRGISYFHENGLIKKSVKIKKFRDGPINPAFTKIVDQYRGKNKYMIIRVSDHHSSCLKAYCDDTGVEYHEYTGPTRKKMDNKFETPLFETEPAKFTIIRIAGLLRMGRELPKQHICAVYESSGKNHDTVAQGLLGRMCGYHTETIDIYIPEIHFRSNGFINEYIEMVNNGHQIGLGNTKHVKGNKLTGDRDGFTVPQIIKVNDRFIDDSDDSNIFDVHRGVSEISLSDDELKDLILLNIDNSRYSDEEWVEIEYMLNSDENNIVIREKHTSNHLIKLNKQIDENIRFESLDFKNKGIILFQMNESTVGTQFEKGDLVVIFRHESFKKGRVQQRTDKKDVFHTKVNVTDTKEDHQSNNIEEQLGGGQYLKLSRETYHNPQELYDSINEAIQNSCDPTKRLKCGRQLTTNGYSNKQVIRLSGMRYTSDTIKYIKIKLDETNKQYNVNVRFEKNYYSLKGTNDIRFNKISW